jgi:hypothetical protein
LGVCVGVLVRWCVCVSGLRVIELRGWGVSRFVWRKVGFFGGSALAEWDGPLPATPASGYPVGDRTLPAGGAPLARERVRVLSGTGGGMGSGWFTESHPSPTRCGGCPGGATAPSLRGVPADEERVEGARGERVVCVHVGATSTRATQRVAPTSAGQRAGVCLMPLSLRTRGGGWKLPHWRESGCLAAEGTGIGGWWLFFPIAPCQGVRRWLSRAVTRNVRARAITDTGALRARRP